ncbi:TMV resistance protein N-like [Prunus avium]|uniref:TMV resistance protein N-like n=1 Tax=Prunus avium TaxID=42229 RepID=A0A6P5RC47_PRUAV|nr:TMV resistance protein N-like [Prunus avium]
MNCRFKDNTEKVLRWRSALREAASLKGYTCKAGESEATFINHIVEEIVVLVLNRTYLNVAKYPVGIHSCVRAVEMLLCAGGNGRRMVGIWGTSGIGKTTIAKAVYNAIAHKFEGCCFLADVRENSMPHGGLIQLQETLLQEILGGKKLKIVSADKGISIIHKLLRHKRILLILDDVNQLEQLDNLAGVGWFGEGSRVIITTQDSGLLKCYGIELIYEVHKLYDNQALELFSLNAFGRNEPPNDYLELVKRAIAYAQGLPLAITLLGSHLHNKGIHRWQAILDGYEGEPYTGIQKILRKSYDALDNSVQQVFLDMACFFKGEDKDYVMQILSSKHKASQDCIEVLVEKAMITIQYNRILMHDLLEKLGKDIVHEECPIEPGKRSRLCCCKEATVFEDPFSDNKGEYVTECEVCFEIPPNLEWETSRLALCAVFDLMTYHGCQFRAKILINGKQVNEIWIWAEYTIKLEETHVWLNCSSLLDPNKNMVEGPTRLQQGNMCQVIFYYQGAGPSTRCGVHLLGHQVGDVSETEIKGGTILRAIVGYSPVWETFVGAHEHTSWGWLQTQPSCARRKTSTRLALLWLANLASYCEGKSLDRKSGNPSGLQKLAGNPTSMRELARNPAGLRELAGNPTSMHELVGNPGRFL